ncbi:Dnaj-like protein subfamily c member 24 [Plakobranchus ocellatus]|uniref:Dnaj-like protein subfamily c member 24 n=1 Tax=Plakobranchus ocellatus TaxID=259542 RepID=A0AAV4C638_9GAST|nr:Dnaj-like protein subfamily c member 24 [Plakobranchus ocellatus]
MENLYDVLQCEHTASRDELRRAYLRLARVHHPDKISQREVVEKASVLPSSKLSLSSFESKLRAEQKSADSLSTEIESSSLSFSEYGCASYNDSVGKDHASGCNFVKIDKAWKILGDPQLRAAYDIKWHDRCLAQEYPIQDTVHFKEFSFDSEEEMFMYPCRCGSDFVLTEFESQLFYDIVCCDTCSFAVKVCYDGS